jgi:hypothetical protein
MAEQHTLRAMAAASGANCRQRAIVKICGSSLGSSVRSPTPLRGEADWSSTLSAHAVPRVD